MNIDICVYYTYLGFIFNILKLEARQLVLNVVCTGILHIIFSTFP